jgi:hypothetical protein
MRQLTGIRVNDLGPMRPDGQPDPRPLPAERVHGVIDVLRPNRVAGWAIDRADAAAAVVVDVLRDGQTVATVTADRHRADLEKGGIGTGRYGFLVTLDPPLDPGFEFTVSAIARSADGHSAVLRPVGAAIPTVPPDLRLLQRLIEGVADLRAVHTRPDPRVADLAAVLDRVEVILARIEGRLDAAETPPAPSRQGRLRLISLGALAVAAVSLTLAVLSFRG